ncbi:MAG: hypothetical protein IT166_15460 [Bryobacterales bacterium]|nr:hypothetical protein [Bryobacterales bacterium]
MSRAVPETGEEKLFPIDGFAIARVFAAGALLLAVRHWPYDYYTVLRWAVCIAGAYGSYRAFNGGNRTWAWIFGSLAVLFNPVAPLHFTRKTWNLLDVLAATVLLLSPVVTGNRVRRADRCGACAVDPAPRIPGPG